MASTATPKSKTRSGGKKNTKKSNSKTSTTKKSPTKKKTTKKTTKKNATKRNTTKQNTAKKNENKRNENKKNAKNSKVSLSQQKKEARIAAQATAERVGKVLLEGNHLSNEPSGRHTTPRQSQVYHFGMASVNMELIHPSDGASVTSESSMLSSERAVRRGSSRGGDEMNERYSSVTGGSMFDIDLTSITEDTTKSAEKHKRRRIRIFKRKRKGGSLASGSSKRSGGIFRLGISDAFLNGETVPDAWMCGCCGKAFSSLKAAECHEDQCILDAIAKLELVEDSPMYLVTPKATTPVWPSPSPRTTNTGGGVSAFFPPTPSQNRLSTRGFPSPGDDDDFHSVHSVEDYQVAANDDNKAIKFSFENMPSSPDRPPLARRASNFGGTSVGDDFLLSPSLTQHIVLTDEALVNTVYRAQTFVITYDEIESERELALLAYDKDYYDLLARRTLERDALKGVRFHTNRKGVLSKVQNKFAEAYELIKEGDARGDFQDQYSRKDKGRDTDTGDIIHDDKTLYVNVIVKNSVRVVENELHRLAKVRWENSKASEEENVDDRFEKFRSMAQSGVVRLAGLALQSDFTPRRIAVQLSNDLYRLMAPQLKRRGVEIETEIEYRVGAFFVLAVNIKKIDWIRLIRLTHREVARRKKLWRLQKMQKEQKLHGDRRSSMAVKSKAPDESEDAKDFGVVRKFLRYMYRLFQLTKFEVIAQCLAWLYHVHWIISVPLCSIVYLLIPSTMRTYILTTVTDEIFSYVEEKGMEMEIKVEVARTQASFMLSALRELRADGRDLKKKRQETEEGIEGAILGPLLGPAIKFDKAPPSPPPGFVPPENLEMVGLEIDLPVGFRRLRWAILSSSSVFVKDAVWKQEAKYENINSGEWSHHNDVIGLPELPDGVTFEDVIGAELETDYLMPKSAFVKANTAYESAMITVYNDHCFCLKKRARTPEVPYGGTFIAWTQYVVTNTGNDTCHMVCSTEAEFPNGPPLVSRQIKSGMRAGTAELFVKIGETVIKYSDEYP